MVLIGPQYMVVAVALPPHSRSVGKMSVERVIIQRYQCILISSTMVLLLTVRIRILLLLG